jgi:acyl dehydratase
VKQTELRRLDDINAIVVGEELDSVQLVPDIQSVRNFVYSIDDFNSWYLYESPFGPPIVPSSMLVEEAGIPLYAKYDVATNNDAVHTRQLLRLFQPITVGQPVVLKAWFSRTYVRRGQPYYEMDGEVLSEQGEKLVWFRFAEAINISYEDGDNGRSKREDGIIAGPPFDDDPPNPPRIAPRESGIPEVSRATPDVAIDAPLPHVRKQFTRKQMFAYSCREFSERNIHTDPKLAQAIGLRDVIASGLMTTGVLAQLCTTFFGEAWFTTGELNHVLIEPVFPDTVFAVSGVVSERRSTADGLRVVVDLWSQTDDGLLLAAGRASAVVASNG